MRLFLSIIAIIILTCTATPNAQSEPLVTISCEKPNGFNIAYGTSFTERVGADQKKQPEPGPSLKGPTKDGYSGAPTFIIDSNKKEMIAVWAELPEDVELKKARAERFGDSNVFRCVFERIVGTCIAAGLVGGEGFAVDASLIQADANKHRSIPGAEWHKGIDPEQARRAVKEYLATLDAPAYGAASDVTPKFVSPSDPAAQWTGALRNAAFFAYANNYLVDVKFGIIMDVEASRAIRGDKARPIAVKSPSCRSFCGSLDSGTVRGTPVDRCGFVRSTAMEKLRPDYFRQLPSNVWQ